MEFVLSVMFTLIGFGLLGLYIYSFILLWGDERFGDPVKLIVCVLFFVAFPASWIYLIYRMFRKKEQ